MQPAFKMAGGASTQPAFSMVGGASLQPTFRMIPLRSGSSGNATLLQAGRSSFLIDCGLNGKALAASLAEFGLQPEDLRGILLTHEHRDHISGLGVVLRRHKIPLYCNAKTLRAARRDIGQFDESLVRLIEAGEPFTVGDFGVTAYRTQHDAADPLCFRIEHERGVAAVCTDLGVADDSVFRAAAGANCVLLEANYNDELLAIGPYPMSLKARIRGGHGHISNVEAGTLLQRLLATGVERICLGHLSQENNYPELALLEVTQQLLAVGAKRERDYQLQVARRLTVSDGYQLA